VFIAAGLGLLTGLLLLIFMHPSRQTPPAVPAMQPAQSQPQTPAAAPDLSNTTAKPSPIQPPTATTNLATTPVTATPPKQVSSDMMDAQLSAPSKIAKDIKTAKPAEDPPPSGLTPVAIDNSGVPGQVFGSENQVKVVPQVSAISAGVAEGMLLHKTEPVYPMIAKASHVSGTVVVKATITKAGTIEGAQMISGPKMLGPAALDAVKGWRYRPYMLDNKPVAVETTISIVFRMGDR
jgi:protein TonB